MLLSFKYRENVKNDTHIKHAYLSQPDTRPSSSSSFLLKSYLYFDDFDNASVYRSEKHSSSVLGYLMAIIRLKTAIGPKLKSLSS